jgi:hypothetical protein
MIVGERGCGKSSIVIDRIKTVCSGEVAEVLALSINTNRFTTARLLYQRLDERLEWKHGRTYVPKGNKRLMCLVDDLNLAQVRNVFCIHVGDRSNAAMAVLAHGSKTGRIQLDTPPIAHQLH